MHGLARLVAPRFHYGWVVAAVIFLSLLSSAGVRSTPGVLIVPLEQAFGWTRATITASLALNLVLYGLMGPFAAAVMQRIGIRRTLLLALALISATVAASTQMTQPWHLTMTWGLFVGLGTGTVALVLGASVVNRWFVERRGLVMGILSASTATGQLVFLPGLAAIAESGGWRPVAWVVAAVAAAMIPLVFFLLPERPSVVGLRSYGATSDDATPPNSDNPIAVALRTLARGARSRDFWLLFGSFFVCGLSTNGLIGTHLIAACFDNGIPEVTAASLLAMMGVFDLIGTTLSGWLSDRWDNRWLLFWYYGLRGLSLMFLPYSDYSFYGLSLFAVFYGLDWIATVPPTVRLTADIFGRQTAPIMFGWILAGHQLGAAVAASGAGYLRTSLDSYLEAFLIACFFCVLTALFVLLIGRSTRVVQPATA
ncbi:MAG: MFS transporter [Proteobacteria bacterium]|nr:MFS transporter [Pseudomonadota bacterium]